MIDVCMYCKKPIKVQIMMGMPWCCEDCRKKLEEKAVEAGELNDDEEFIHFRILDTHQRLCRVAIETIDPETLLSDYQRKTKRLCQACIDAVDILARKQKEK